MIDTDKYEGHTEGPWELIEREGTGLFNLVMWRREEKKAVAYAYNSGKYTYEYPNAQLIADAPLLLEEVKRLRAEHERAVAILRHHQMTSPGAVGVKSSCGIASACRLILNILEGKAE